MRRLLWLGFVAVLLFVSGQVRAEEGGLTFQWTNSDKNLDGTVLAPTDIQSTRIEIGTCNGSAFGAKLTDWILQGATTSAFVAMTTPGLYCGRLYTTAKGSESPPSNPAQGMVTITAPPPTGPVTVDTVAYKKREDVDAVSYIPFGTVPLGTKCLPQTSDSYTAVPRATVVKNVRFDVYPPRLFAKCQ